MMEKKPTYRKYLWILAFVGLLADQASKYAVFSWLKDRDDHRSVVTPGYFELVAQRDRVTGQELVNKGALFGFGREYDKWANGTFAVISLLAAIAIVLWSIPRSTAEDRGLCFALGLILGGTLGNLYDRRFFGGVRDFLYVHYKDSFDWPVFNIADCCLVCGAGLLLIQAFRPQPHPEKKENEKPTMALAAESGTNVEAVSSIR